jgi:hypothetical protein
LLGSAPFFWENLLARLNPSLEDLALKGGQLDIKVIKWQTLDKKFGKIPGHRFWV